MLRYSLIVASVVTIAAAIPLAHNSGWVGSAKPVETSPAKVVAAKLETPAPAIAGRTVRISADGRGHYFADFTINGRKVNGLIDTGASLVAVNKSIAKRLGVSLSSSDFTREVNTANGTIKAASIVLSRIEIGRIQVKDVRAVVLDDASLDGTLIGMSFLNNLRFSVEDNTFILKQ